MSRPRLILIGGGEHARVVAEVVRSQGDAFDLLGFVDPAECADTVERLGLVRLGGEAVLPNYWDALGLLGLGSTGVTSRRAEIARRVGSTLKGWATVVHQRASVSPTAVVGEGTVVMAGAIVNTGARLGTHCVVNTGAIIEHDVVLGDHAFVGPAAAIGGGSRIDAGGFVGLGAVIRDHVRVGADAVVGMGAIVVADVPPGSCVMGVPAKPR